MKVRVQCPNPDCGKRYEVQESQLGSIVACKRCGQKFTLSATDRQTSDAAAGSETAQPADGKSVKTRSAKDKPSEARKPPTKLGRFEIRSRLGSGAFGAVYRAYDPVLDREVALKVPRAGVLEKPNAKARFLREPKAAAKLQHPHIVPVFDAGVDGEHYYIASAFIEGQTLQVVIADERPDFRRAAEMIRDLADALHYAHQKGIVHRDVKPANIMIDRDGSPMLMDFGIAHLQESEEQLTQDGTMMGTPGYMSPEQADVSFGDVGPASDQYSLGVVLYELLCGQTPFNGPPTVLIHNLVTQEPVAPSKTNPAVPKDLETICLKAMAKEPGKRYVDCAAAAEDLRRWLADEPIKARRMGTVERFGRWCRRNPVLATASTTAVLLLLAVTFVSIGYVYTSSERDREAAQRQQTEAELKQVEADLTAATLALQQATVDLEQAKLALQQAEAEFAEAQSEAERTEALRKVEEAKRLLAEAARRQAEAKLTQTELEKARAQVAENVEQAKRGIAGAERQSNGLEPVISPTVTDTIEPLSPSALVSCPARIEKVREVGRSKHVATEGV